MVFKYSYILFLFVVLFNDTTKDSNSETSENISLITTQTSYVAGKRISLEFSNITTDVYLICSNSYGTTVLKPKMENNITSFQIPETIY